MTYSPDTLHAQLEKLEQNITFTLQEIDTNFAACHQVVSTRLLKNIEKFAEASEGVWEGGKFWLSFFDALDLTISNTTDRNTSITNRPNISTASNKSNDVNPDETSLTEPLTTADLDTPLSSTPRWQHADGIFQSPWNKIGQQPGLERFQDVSVIQSGKAGEEFMMSTPSTVKPSSKSGEIEPSQSIRLLSKVLNKQFLAAQQERDSIQFQKQQSRRLQKSKDSFQAPRPPLDTTLTPITPSILQDNNTNLTALDSDDDEVPPYSPPITIQFSLPPSKLMKTPAKLAAKTVIEDVLSREGIDSFVSTPLEFSTRFSERNQSPASKSGSDMSSIWSSYKADNIPGSTASKAGSVAESEAPNISNRWKNNSTLGSAASKLGTLKENEMEPPNSALSMRDAPFSSAASSRSSISTSKFQSSVPKYNFDQYDYGDGDDDDDADDKDIEQLLNITTKLSPLPMDKNVQLADDENIIQEENSVLRKRSVVTPGKIDAILDEDDFPELDGEVTPRKVDRLLDAVVDESDEKETHAVEKQDRQERAELSLREHSQRSIIYNSASFNKRQRLGTNSLNTSNQAFDTYSEDDEEEDDDDGGIVNSPCPPGIWLNVSEFTPKGKSRSPFRLVGSPTLQRVMNDVRTEWSGSKRDDQSGLNLKPVFDKDDSDDEVLAGNVTINKFDETLQNSNEIGELTRQFGPWRTIKQPFSSVTKDLATGSRSSPEMSGSIVQNLTMGPTEFRPEFDAALSDYTRDLDTNLTGISGIIPTVNPKFSLNLFPTSFQHPPGSTQLIQVYNILSSSSTPLSLSDLFRRLNNDSFDNEKLKLLLDLLLRKKVVDRVGDGWIARS